MSTTCGPKHFANIIRPSIRRLSKATPTKMFCLPRQGVYSLPPRFREATRVRRPVGGLSSPSSWAIGHPTCSCRPSIGATKCWCDGPGTLHALQTPKRCGYRSFVSMRRRRLSCCGDTYRPLVFRGCQLASHTRWYVLKCSGPPRPSSGTRFNVCYIVVLRADFSRELGGHRVISLSHWVRPAGP